MLVVSYQEFGLPGGLVVKNLPAVQETGVQFLGREDLEEGMAAHSSLLAQRAEHEQQQQHQDGSSVLMVKVEQYLIKL